MAALLFASFAFMPFLVPFPFAGVATLGLGPLSRAGAAWSFLAAVAAYVLKDATQRGRIHSGKTFRFLRPEICKMQYNYSYISYRAYVNMIHIYRYNDNRMSLYNP